jgi:predicted nucleic acid-binding protein
MIFIDSNIPMYLIGADHENKHRAAILCEELIRSKVKFVTSAEVLQEIMHRYTAINRRENITYCIDLIQDLCDQIYPITKDLVIVSKNLLLENDNLSARDALHVATIKQLGISKIFSFDKDFDQFKWLQRIC